ncbi:MAG TPA: hypothetical protein VJZ71_15215 [Phycisphaerae bacterium]|nr:hypothetical protein [Phycisphaerae bacterium]
MSPRFRVAILALGLLTVAHSGPARAEDPLRVRGVIDADQSWAGHVLITGETMIDGATVSVAAGTTIEFAVAETDIYPTLTVGSPVHRGGRLELLATSSQPITIRTRTGTNAGRIIVYLRGRRPPTSAPTLSGESPAPLADVQSWRFIRFEDLGFTTSAPAMMGQVSRLEPAVLFHILEPETSLTITECTFDKSSSLTIEARAVATIAIRTNHFTSPKGRTAIDMAADPESRRSDALRITENRAAAAIRLRAGPALIDGNILIGPDACIVADDSPAQDVRITGNYVHNTTKQDDGHYCLNCENPDAAIESNILRGGTACVVSGSRRFKGNILIAEPELASPAVRRAQTHQLVAALPAGALFERNLLIGPAYSMVVPQALTSKKGYAPTDPTLIRNNTFDGLMGANRAIHINPAGLPPITLRIENSVFLRISKLVYDESRKGPSLAYADYNAAAPTPRRAFDQVSVANFKEGQDGWAAHDLRRDQITDLRLSALPDRIPDYDADMQSGKLTIAALREKLFDAYRPLPDSPLVGAGRTDSGAGAPHALTIGCCEPSKR